MHVTGAKNIIIYPHEKEKSPINKLADDFDSCETRILLGEKPVCRKGCSYFEHCQRVAKGHY